MQELMERPRAGAGNVIENYIRTYHQHPVSYKPPEAQQTVNYQGAHSSPRPTATPSASTRTRRVSPSSVPVVDLTRDSPPRTAPKRKREQAGDETSNLSPQSAKAPKNNQEAVKSNESPKKAAKKVENGEKRMRIHRPRPPQDYLVIRERALTQRMYVLDRQQSDNSGIPTETVTIAGTTGNVYRVTIGRVPSCDCPYARKGNQCKHIAYVLSRVLRVRSELEYQLAFIDSELKEIFQNAPPLPSETVEEDAKDGNRKHIEGDCPICCVEFEPASGEKIVYCKAACGQNVHDECFSRWAATKGGIDVPCPFCRTPWQQDEEQLKRVASSGERNAEGYVNVASQLGMSGRRDYSTYHPFWVSQQADEGHIAWDDEGVMHHTYH